jgi:hypothetical protein
LSYFDENCPCRGLHEGEQTIQHQLLVRAKKIIKYQIKKAFLLAILPGCLAKSQLFFPSFAEMAYNFAFDS